MNVDSIIVVSKRPSILSAFERWAIIKGLDGVEIDSNTVLYFGALVAVYAPGTVSFLFWVCLIFCTIG